MNFPFGYNGYPYGNGDCGCNNGCNTGCGC